MKLFSRIFNTILYIINTVLTICGFSFFVCGIIWLTEASQYKYMYNDLPIVCEILALANGLIVLITCLINYYAIYERHLCLLFSITDILLIQSMIHFAIGIYFIVVITDLKDENTEELLRTLFNISNTDFNIIEIRFQCCGILSSKEYATTPYSCCEEQYNPCLKPYRQGCSTVIKKYYSDTIHITGSLCVSFTVVAIIYFILILTIKRRSNNKEPRY